MRSAESLRYNLTVPLRIAVFLFASAMTWAQTPRADLQGAQLGAAAEHLQQGRVEQAIRECKVVLATDPRSAPAHMLLGLAYLAQRSTAMVGEAKGELQQALDARGLSAEFLVVSYDPANDDPLAWRRYRTRHGLFRGNWHFLSGTPADTERLARVLGFEFWRDGEHVMHDFRIVALDGDGAQRGVIDSAHGDWRSLL